MDDLGMIFQPSGYNISYKQNDFHTTEEQYISHKWLNWDMNFWPCGSYSAPYYAIFTCFLKLFHCHSGGKNGENIAY